MLTENLPDPRARRMREALAASSRLFQEPIRRLTLAAVLVMGAACQELAVVNPNEPDRERALLDTGDVQALIGGSFEIWIQDFMNNSDPGITINVMGPDKISVSSAATEVTEEPRRAFRTDDSPGGPARHMSRLWRSTQAMSSNSHDFLRTVEERGLKFTEGSQDVTLRNRAYAKFVQGMAWGYMVTVFDQGIMIPETVAMSDNARAQGVEHLIPWQEGIQKAVESLEAAIAIAQQKSFTFPSASQSRLWFGTPGTMSSGQFSQLANTMAARFLVESARTPKDRAQVDWNRVLKFTANGLASDFEVVLAPGIRVSEFLARMENNAPGCAGACARLGYRFIGMADISGAYQRWLGQPISERNRFDIVTPDRRITGPTPQSTGAYVTWWADDNGFPSTLGFYRRSAYQWARHRNRGFFPNIGTMTLASVDENRLLRAEALLHTGDLNGAAALINVTRTRSHKLPDGVTYSGLPPVTAAGVPKSADCVPRTDAGACGDLLVALRYERMLELIGLNPVRGYSDARGFGMLPEGTAVHFPIIVTELQALGLAASNDPGYTFGGTAGGGAVYNPEVVLDWNSSIFLLSAPVVTVHPMPVAGHRRVRFRRAAPPERYAWYSLSVAVAGITPELSPAARLRARIMYR